MLSAISGSIASTICHPLDVIRVQLQTNSSSPSVAAVGGAENIGPVDAAKRIVRGGGVLALWDGLSAAYLRQFSYSMVRIGLFSYMLDAVKLRQQGSVGLVGWLVAHCGFGFVCHRLGWCLLCRRCGRPFH